MNIHKSRFNLFFKQLITLLVVVSPILAPYNSGISFLILPELLFILLLPIILFDYLTNNHKLEKNKYNNLLLFYYIINFLALLAYFYQPSFSLNEFLKASLRMGFYIFLILFISNRYFDFKIGMKFYEFFATIASIYLIIQTISFYKFSYILPWYIPRLSMHSETYLNANFEQLFSHFYRPSSFFIEPAHFAQYVLPILMYELFINNKSNYKRLFIAILITAALVLSTSGTGIIVATILWIYWFIKRLTQLNKTNIIKVFIIIFASILFINFNQMDSNIISKSVDRLSLQNPMSSTNIRVTRGFVVYSQMPLSYKLFGIGFGNYGAYVENNNITTIYDLEGNSVWVNAGAYVLTGSGILGFIFLILTLVYFIKKTEGFFRIRAIMLLVSIFYSDEITTISIVLTFSILYEGIFQKNKKFSSINSSIKNEVSNS